MKIKLTIIAISLAFFTSCSEDVDFSDHQLVGTYEGLLETSAVPVARTIIIEPTDENDGLTFSIQDSPPEKMELDSETMFSTPTVIENGFTIDTEGYTEGDSLFITISSFHSSAPDEVAMRDGRFKKQN